MKILAISYKHLTDTKYISKVDLVLYCADMFNKNVVEFIREIDLLAEKLVSLGRPECIYTSGNHAEILEEKTIDSKIPDLKECMEYIKFVSIKNNLNITVAVDDIIQIKGYWIYFSPPNERINLGEIILDRYLQDRLRRLLKNIPKNPIDVLITHDSPGLLDVSPAHEYKMNLNSAFFERKSFYNVSLEPQIIELPELQIIRGARY